MSKKKNYQVAFKFGADAGGLKQALRSSSSMLGAFGKELGNLGKTQANIKGLPGLQESIKKNVAAMRALDNGTGKDRLSAKLATQKANLDRLQASIKKNTAALKNMEDGATKDLLSRRIARQQNSLLSLRGVIKQNSLALKQMERDGAERDRLSQKIRNQQKSLVGLRGELKKTGVDLRQLAKAEEQAAAAANKMRAAQENLERASARSAGIKQKRDNYRVQMLDAYALAKTMMAPVESAVKFESAMADVKKVVDFDTPEQFKQMGTDILEMGREIPMAHDGLASIVAAGGQAGLHLTDGTEGLKVFAKDAAKMGTAFDITAQEAGQAMAGWRSAFRYNQEEVRVLADQINFLGNTTAASAPKISEVVTRIGALGEVAGVNSGQVAALGATLTGMNIGPEIAATGIKKLMLVMNAGDAATKKQSAAFEKLGLNSKKLSRSMQKDGEKTILYVLEKISKLDKMDQTSMLKQLFGEEAVASIAPLLANLDTLKKNFDKVSDSTNYAGSMEKEFQARCETTENSLQLLKNSAVEFGTAMGDTLLPSVDSGSKSLSGMFHSMTGWIKENPKLASGIVKVAAGLMAMKVATIALGYGLTFITGPLAALDKGFAMFRAAKTLSGLGNIRTAVLLLNTAIKANPIMFIAGLTATAVGLIAANWDSISGAASAAWDSIKTGASASWARIQSDWAATKAWFSGLWEGLKAVASAYWSGLTGLASDAWEGIKLVWSSIGSFYSGLWTMVKGIFTGNWAEITAGASAAWEAFKAPAVAAFNWIASKFAWLKEAFNSISWDSIKSKFSGGPEKALQSKMQGFASGGVVTRPTFAMVGEGGDTETIVPHNKSPRSYALWENAGKAIGAFSGDRLSPAWEAATDGRPAPLQAASSTGGSGGWKVDVTFAPQYHIQGNGDERVMQQTARMTLDDLRTMFDDLLRDNARVALA